MFLIIIGSLLLMPGYAFQANEKDPEIIISQANNEFSFKIFKMLSNDENDVMSPLSILSALTILMNGAKGHTLDDMKRFLEYNTSLQKSNEESVNEGFKIISKRYRNYVEAQNNQKIDENQWDDEVKHQLNLANLVIYNQNYELLPEFKNIVTEYFKGEVQNADIENNAIEETNKINEWIRNQTNNKIQKLFNKLSDDTTAIIVNALYFKGLWTDQFFRINTNKMDFYNNGENVVEVNTMFKEEMFMYSECEELNSQLLQMDYIGNNISFVVVLPKDRNGLTSLKEKINAQNFDRALKSMQTKNLKVYLPKFKVEKSYDLMKNINPKPIALTPDADLSRIASEPIIVSQIIHKVFIGIDERGTEAAAATGIPMFPISAFIPFKTFVFRADHPFLYFILDVKNSMILFSGQINKL